ncbi:hypothetical protein HQ520_06330 [bacterium]|nr:hypothetical protein [bacterium]
MNAIRRLLIFLTLLGLFVLGIIEVTRELLRIVGPTAWVSWIDARLAFFDDPYFWGVKVAFMVIVPLLVVLVWLRQRGRNRVLSLVTESEQLLKISRTAVQDFIHDDLIMLSYVRDARVAAGSRRGTLVVQARVRIINDGPLDNLQARILDRIRSSARDGLGVRQIGEIDLKFESVRLGKDRQRDPDKNESPREAAAVAAHPEGGSAVGVFLPYGSQGGGESVVKEDETASFPDEEKREDEEEKREGM